MPLFTSFCMPCGAIQYILSVKNALIEPVTACRKMYCPVIIKIAHSPQPPTFHFDLVIGSIRVRQFNIQYRAILSMWGNPCGCFFRLSLGFACLCRDCVPVGEGTVLRLAVCGLQFASFPRAFRWIRSAQGRSKSGKNRM